MIGNMPPSLNGAAEWRVCGLEISDQIEIFSNDRLEDRTRRQIKITLFTGRLLALKTVKGD